MHVANATMYCDKCKKLVGAFSFPETIPKYRDKAKALIELIQILEPICVCPDCKKILEEGGKKNKK